jgi:L-seryl-tRNA(Ser) seleniumtransferase
MDESMQKVLRALPSVEELVSHPATAELLRQHPRNQVVEALRAAVESARQAIRSGGAASGGAGGGGSTAADMVSPENLVEEAAALLDAWLQPGLRRVANLSGVVIHTNLGRSPLAEAAIDRVVEVARGYSNLEYELGPGTRGHRETHVEGLLTRLTGAEAAIAVNNNAGAVLLLLMALAGGREVLVSRGQLVEIGGSFRMPDIMRAGGVRLIEVGTTNRTRLEDYEAAITGETAMLLRVHTSNYRIVGFTEETSLADLVELGRQRDLVVVDDLGSGALQDLPAYHGEPSVAESLKTGADLVCFSGDKLLGGPQAGVLVGKAAVIDRLRKHPVARALRLDKMTLAALEATLAIYRDPETAGQFIPTLRLLNRTSEQTAVLAASLQTAIEARSDNGFILEVEESSARAGGGSMPLVELRSHAVRIRFPEPPVSGGVLGGTARPAGTAGRPEWSTAADHVDVRTVVPTVSARDAALRRAPLPVVTRVAQDSLHLDVMALDERDVDDVAASVAWAIGQVLAGAGSTVKTAPGGGES